MPEPPDSPPAATERQGRILARVLRRFAVPLLLAGLVLAVAVLAAGMRPSRPFRRDVPFVVTPEPVVRSMLELAALQPGELLVDLGSGDGRIVVTAAAVAGARAVGVEIDPELVAASRRRARRAGVADHTEFLRKDLFEADLARADVVTIYLLPGVNRALRPRLLRELRPGARVVSHRWDMGGWRPDATVAVAGPPRSTIHAWTVPAAAGGEWMLESPDGPARLLLLQRFQQVHGLLVDGNGERAVSGRLEGSRLRLRVDLPGGQGEADLRGRVGDRRMELRDASAGPTAGPAGVWRGRRRSVDPTGVWSWRNAAGAARTLRVEVRPDGPWAELDGVEAEAHLWGGSVQAATPASARGAGEEVIALVRGDRLEGEVRGADLTVRALGASRVRPSGTGGR